MTGLTGGVWATANVAATPSKTAADASSSAKRFVSEM